ncbi:MAG: metallophosphoesterase [Endomicrobiaceae bacterium]|nr:metallophosphoesterase [Endomicrobiaceae bacterium]
MKKILSIVVACFIFYSFIFVDIIHAIMFLQPTTVSIQSSVGTVSDSFINANDKELVVFIQDLHSNPSVQKNISKIIDTFNKNYGVSKILIEGAPYGKINTKVIDLLREYDIYKISNSLLNKGLFTGTEYYISNDNKDVPVYGLEEWNIYLSNIKRAAEIQQNDEYIQDLYSNLKETILKRIKNSKKLSKYIEFDLTNDKLLRNINQPILKYNMLHQYIQLADISNKLNTKKITKEHNNFIIELQSRIPFDKYKEIINKSKKDNPYEYYLSLYSEFNEEYSYFIAKYANLYNFLEYSLEKEKINTVSLISQQNKYFKDYLKSLSTIQDQDKQDSIFVLKMTQLLGLFLKLTISEEEYTYFIENYERYINLLSKYLSEDYYTYEDLFDNDVIFDYHQINRDRNKIFLNNIKNLLSHKEQNKKITVVVAGGFHTTVLEGLKENNISYLLITPSVNESTNNNNYNNIILSTLDNKFADQALSPIPLMLANSSDIPQGTKIYFLQKLVETLSETNTSPNVIKQAILKLSREILIFDNPILVDYDQNKFSIIIGKEKLSFKIIDEHVYIDEENKIIDKNEKVFKHKIIDFIKRTFHIFQASYMVLRPEFSSKLFSTRNDKSPSFVSATLFNLFHLNKIAYKYMLEFGNALVGKGKAVKYDDLIIKTNDGIEKKISIIVEKQLNQYLSKEILQNILDEAMKRINNDNVEVKDTIVIGLLSKSTNLFEDHLNNGFIGVNEAIFKIDNEIVKEAFIKTGIIHEISHELKGKSATQNYKNNEDELMFSDIKFIIEYVENNLKINQEEYDISKEVYTKEFDDKIRKTIIDAVRPIFADNLRFLRKLKNYKFNIEEIIEFIKRKDFLIGDRKGQLKHIEAEYLDGNLDVQQEFFSKLIVNNQGTMLQFLDEHVDQKRINDVSNRINTLLFHLRSVLESSDINNKELEDKIIREFESNIYNCLDLMYKKMPKYLFGKYYNEKVVIADHALNHSIEVLSYTVDILSREISSFETLDVESLVYSAFLHDISCSFVRLNHESNSATWARSILSGTLEDAKVDKIVNICLGHKKVKNGLPREEHSIYEARLLHDADGLSAVLDLNRILGVWLIQKEAFINESLSIDERIKLIENNIYLSKEGGDAVNDLMRQFLRRNQNLYLTNGAKEIIRASKSDPHTVAKFITTEKTIDTILNSGMHIKIEDIVEASQIINQVLSRLIPDYSKSEQETNLNIEQTDSEFGFKAKLSLFKQILAYVFFNKQIDFKQNIAISDIHGGYARLTDLIINLIDPTYNTNGLEYKEIEKEVIDRLSYSSNTNMFYILGDTLDRGGRQVESFEFIKKIVDAGKGKYIIGNHDLYAFMNLLGLHLPSYEHYKGISNDYIDYAGRNIKVLLELKRATNPKSVNNKLYWASKFDEYMEYADTRQKNIWNKKEKELQELFYKTFAFQLDSKGKDVLNNSTNTIFENDDELLKFHKKVFGRNVGITVYTGIRAVDKMSINWWIDRQKELKNLKGRYPNQDFANYWTTLDKLINDILTQQKEKMELEDSKGNWEWAIVDAVMYRNYESTEWNALDWAYHNNWGGGAKGFIAQRNIQLTAEGKPSIDHVSYFDDKLINELLNFFKKNFYLYRIDEYGIYYMHSLLPVDDDGDISIGYVDKYGVFQEYDISGRRIKGFYYKDKQYTGKNIFKGLTKIASDIRNYDISTNNLSEISEALTLLTSIYADATTRIKPENLKEIKEKFGFSEILNKKGITTLIVGHNPVTKLDNAYEFVPVRIFNKDFKIINLVHIDGNMSPEYAPPKGAGIARLIGGGINTRGFISGESTEITSSTTPDVTFSTFMISIVLNLFPFLKKICLFSSNLYDQIDSLNATVNSKFAKNTNTLLINISNKLDEIKKFEIANSMGAKTLAIASVDTVAHLPAAKQKIETKIIKINGEKIKINILLNQTKIAGGYIDIIAIDYDKENVAYSVDEILSNITPYILDQIVNNKYAKYIKNRSNIALINNDLSNTFDLFNKSPNKKLSKILEKTFGVIPILYDVRNKKSIPIITELTQTITLDKTRKMLAAA